MSASIPLIEEGVANAAPKVASAFEGFWASLSRTAKSAFKGPGGKVLKTGAQIGSAVALPAAGIYSLEQAASPITKGVDTITGIPGAGQLVIIGILAFLAIMFLLVLFR